MILDYQTWKQFKLKLDKISRQLTTRLLGETAKIAVEPNDDKKAPPAKPVTQGTQGTHVAQSTQGTQGTQGTTAPKARNLS